MELSKDQSVISVWMIRSRYIHYMSSITAIDKMIRYETTMRLRCGWGQVRNSFAIVMYVSRIFAGELNPNRV